MTDERDICQPFRVTRLTAWLRQLLSHPLRGSIDAPAPGRVIDDPTPGGTRPGERGVDQDRPAAGSGRPAR